tara:strand:+ start:338 stop:1141 length:804 start_codon:yes stop_codon:yes gene_type:complete
MIDNNPLISVIMNCYNGEKYLKESVQSLFNQSYTNWELIFWDNLSTDKSSKIIKEFNNKKIKYYLSEKFTNLYEARNCAISKCNGSLIAFLDTDDWWSKDKLQKQINLFAKNKDLGLIYSNCYLYNQSDKKVKIFKNHKLPEGKITQELLNNYCIGILTILVNKDVFDNNYFNNKYNIIGDFDFITKLSKKINFGCIQEPLAYGRKHGKNLSDIKLKLYISELKEWIKDNQKTFIDEGYSLFNQKIFLKKLQIKYYLKKINFFNTGV